jgi:transposase
MDTINLLRVSPETRRTIKEQAIRLYKKGKSESEIADALNISYQAVSRIIRAYKKEGMRSVKEKTRGRKLGEKRSLTPEQEKEIQRIIIDKCPDQLKIAACLWTRAAIQQLIKSKYGITIPVRSISNYLDRWGMSCQRPTKKAYSQDDVKLKEFMNETYPEIAAKAKKENAEIYWGDETGINNQEYHVRGFAPKGQTPTAPSFSKVEKINMISAINNKGTCRFMCYEDNMTQQRFITFLTRLIHDAEKKVLLIVDNLRVHHGKLVQAWLSEHQDEIELFFTSPYSPEINPDEYLNHNLKQSVHSGILPHNKKDLKAKTHSFMRKLQKHPEKVRKLFDHKNLKYIQQCEC